MSVEKIMRSFFKPAFIGDTGEDARNIIAMMAMHAMYTNGGDSTPCGDRQIKIGAIKAYQIADAMIWASSASKDDKEAV